jgi:hypothetical protein
MIRRMDAKPPVCGDCKHFHKLQRDPMNLAGPVPGECREHVKSYPMIRNGQMVGQLVYYASPGTDFPACSRFAASLKVVT